MFRNYFLIATRNLIRNKVYTIVNLVGLAIGITCFTLIFMYVKDELSYDRFSEHSERIYRVTGKLELEGQGEHSSSCPFPVGPTLVNDYPQLIEKCVRFFNFQDALHSLSYKNKVFNEDKIFLADSGTFTMFQYPLAEGNPGTALKEPNSIVLSEKLAKKYFGDEDPMGKIIRFEGNIELIVTGIFGDLPRTSHIQFDALISFSTIEKIWVTIQKNWVWNPCWTYVMLKEGVTPDELRKEFPLFVQKYYPDFLKNQVTHDLQHLPDIHLDSHLDYEMYPNGNRQGIYIFSVIGIFILLIACVNFMNLATAQSASRAREVGVRKAAGAQKGQLVLQFLTESLLMSVMAALLSIALIELSLPLFSSVSGKELSSGIQLTMELIPQVLIIALITSLLSGLYPAFFLSSFQPIVVLKGNSKGSMRGQLLRKILVVFQFTISLVLIIGTIFIVRQHRHLQSADLGFNQESVIMIPVRPPMAEVFLPLLPELEKISGVKNVATANDIIGKHHNTHEFNYDGMEKGKWKYYPCLLVNETFLPTLQLPIIAGRNFSKDMIRDDSLAVIVNETFVNEMKWGSPQDAIGKRLNTPHGAEKVVGVVSDFYFDPLIKPVSGFVFDVPHNNDRLYWLRFIYVSIESGETKSVIAEIEKKWKAKTTDFPFEYEFLSQDLDDQYKDQQTLGNLVGIFSVLAIIIACMGLYALAAFTTEKRTKEIGIRKVLGAGIVTILYELTRNFLVLVVLANCIAWPLTWMLISYWLENFAYRTPLDISVFIFSGLAVLTIALLTVIFKARKVANANPVNALRYE